jgi:transposase
MRLLMDELVIQGKKDKQFIIDLNDPLQLRYELVRELKLSGSPKEEICTKFRYSRVMGHLYETAWDKNRWDGLKEKKKGPKRKPKRTEDLENRILAIRFKHPEKDMYEITDILTEEGYHISARSVARVLLEHGVALKKTKMKS